MYLHWYVHLHWNVQCTYRDRLLQVPKVPGDYEVNSVLGEVLTSCAAYTSKPPKSAGESSATGENSASATTTSATAGDVPDLGNVYRYIGGILANGEESNEIPVKLNGK